MPDAEMTPEAAVANRNRSKLERLDEYWESTSGKSPFEWLGKSRFLETTRASSISVDFSVVQKRVLVEAVEAVEAERLQDQSIMAALAPSSLASSFGTCSFTAESQTRLRASSFAMEGRRTKK